MLPQFCSPVNLFALPLPNFLHHWNNSNLSTYSWRVRSPTPSTSSLAVSVLAVLWGVSASLHPSAVLSAVWWRPPWWRPWRDCLVTWPASTTLWREWVMLTTTSSSMYVYIIDIIKLFYYKRDFSPRLTLWPFITAFLSHKFAGMTI